MVVYFSAVWLHLFSAKTSTEGPVVDADGSVSFALDEYFDSPKPFPKTEIKEEKSQEIPQDDYIDSNDFNWEMATVGKYQNNL